jgi:hypothetical protein
MDPLHHTQWVRFIPEHGRKTLKSLGSHSLGLSENTGGGNRVDKEPQEGLEREFTRGRKLVLEEQVV